MRGRLLLGLFVLGLVGVTVAAAGINRNWSVHANGSQEVPARDTQGQGQAIFHLSKDGSSLDYQLIASNIENVFMAHIHQNAPGVNGPIVVWLYPSTAVAPGPFGAGRTDGVLATGTITAANLVGPLAGHPLSDLVEAMSTGNAYVNLHTNDGVDARQHGRGRLPGRRDPRGHQVARAEGAPRRSTGRLRPPRTIRPWATGTRSGSRSGWASPPACSSPACSPAGGTGSSPRS